MTPETLEALKASIAKWERNAVAETPETYSVSARSCPLCDLFYADNCSGCPVSMRTKKLACSGTPYIAASLARSDWEWRGLGHERAHAAARDEVAFLKSLLPQGEETA